MYGECSQQGLLAFVQMFDAEYRKDIPNVVRWYTTLVHFPHFNAVFVEKNLCKQRLKCKLPQARWLHEHLSPALSKDLPADQPVSNVQGLVSPYELDAFKPEVSV